MRAAAQGPTVVTGPRTEKLGFAKGPPGLLCIKA